MSPSRSLLDLCFPSPVFGYPIHVWSFWFHPYMSLVYYIWTLRGCICSSVRLFCSLWTFVFNLNILLQSKRNYDSSSRQNRYARCTRFGCSGEWCFCERSRNETTTKAVLHESRRLKENSTAVSIISPETNHPPSHQMYRVTFTRGKCDNLGNRETPETLSGSTGKGGTNAFVHA